MCVCTIRAELNLHNFNGDGFNDFSHLQKVISFKTAPQEPVLAGVTIISDRRSIKYTNTHTRAAQ